MTCEGCKSKIEVDNGTIPIDPGFHGNFPIYSTYEWANGKATLPDGSVVKVTVREVSNNSYNGQCRPPTSQELQGDPTLPECIQDEPCTIKLVLRGSIYVEEGGSLPILICTSSLGEGNPVVQRTATWTNLPGVTLSDGTIMFDFDIVFELTQPCGTTGYSSLLGMLSIDNEDGTYSNFTANPVYHAGGGGAPSCSIGNAYVEHSCQVCSPAAQ